jgi:hypothetical protein
MEAAVIEVIIWAVMYSVLQGWNGIVPLHTTRSHVEKILGPPTESCDKQCNYKKGDDRVFIRYSGEPCSQGNSWRIPADTVIEISVYQGRKPRISNLRLDRRKFKKTYDLELHGYYWYENEEAGVAYEVSAEGRVIGNYWFGASADDKKLRCSFKRSHK